MATNELTCGTISFDVKYQLFYGKCSYCRMAFAAHNLNAILDHLREAHQQTLDAAVRATEDTVVANAGCGNEKVFPNCECKCKCCRGLVQKYVNFDLSAPSSATQKKMRLSTAELLQMLRVAQTRENFWSNQIYKADLQPDYQALSAAFNAGESQTIVGQLDHLMDTITTGFRRALTKLSISEASGALKPPDTTQKWMALRCGCTECGQLPWIRIRELHEHQRAHKPSDNFHCRLCYRRYYLQHALLSHQSMRVQRGQESGQLQQNEAYQTLLEEQQQAEILVQETDCVPVEAHVVRIPHNNALDYVQEVETRVRLQPRKRCLATGCARCHKQYRYTFSHQWHMRLNHVQSTNVIRWSCASCPRSFRTLTAWLRHHKRVWRACNRRQCKYKCGRCDARFHFLKTLQMHYDSIHRRNYNCLICKAPLLDQRTCSTHSAEERTAAISESNRKKRRMRGLPDKPAVNAQTQFLCEVCSKPFRVPFNLKVHMKTVHLKQADFSCETCGKLFYSQKAVSCHVKTVHLLNNIQICETCNISINSKHNFSRHLISKSHQRMLKKRAEQQQQQDAKQIVDN